MVSNNIASMLLWEDQDLIILNKPSGLLSIQDGYDPDLPYLKQMLAEKFQQIFVVHRLDKETSGTIIFAKNIDAHRHLSRQFEERSIKKEYHAIIYGKPGWNELLVDASLLVNGDRKHRTVYNEKKGKPAQTQFSLITSFPHYSLISAHPFTGYRHQIRAHLYHIGLSIIGDSLYSVKKESPDEQPIINRVALHAFSISFLHPISENILTVNAPYPEDFKNAVAKNKKKIHRN